MDSANETQARYVDVDAEFNGHRWCEPGGVRESWFNGWLGPGDTLSMANPEGIMVPENYYWEGMFLPTITGHEAFTRAILRKMGLFQEDGTA